MCGLLVTVLLLRRDTMAMATHKRKHLIGCLLKMSETSPLSSWQRSQRQAGSVLEKQGEVHSDPRVERMRRRDGPGVNF